MKFIYTKLTSGFCRFFLALVFFSPFLAKADCTISGNVTQASNPLGSCSGVVTITGKLSIAANYNVSSTGITKLIIATGGTLDVTGNTDFTLPANTVFIIEPQPNGTTGLLFGGPCNANRRILVGTVVLATCNGNGSAYSFQQLNTFGGSASVSPSFTPYCAGANTLSLFANRTGGDPTPGNLNFSWSGPGGFTSILQNPTRTPIVEGVYTCTVTDPNASNYTNTNSVTVAATAPIIFTTQPLATQTVPLGTPPTNLTIATTGGIAPVTYLWYANTINSYTGASIILNATGTSYTPPTNAATITYYFCRATPGGGLNCGPVNSNIAKVSILDARTWTGALSTDWNTPGNWLPIGVPGSGSDVTIPPVTNQPILATNVIVKNVDLQAGSSLTLNGKDFSANGPFVGNGTIYGSNTSSLYLRDQTNNTTLNFYTGSLEEYYSLQNLYISGSGATTLGTPLNITFSSGTVDVERAGTLVSNGNLKLESLNGSSYIKNLSDNGGGTIIGNVKVERFYTAANGRKWRLANAPLKGSNNNSIYYNWQNNGVIGNSSGAEIWAPNNIVGYSTPNANPLGYASGPNPGNYSIRGYSNTTGFIVNPPSTKAAGSLFDANGPKPFFFFPTSPFKNGGGRIIYNTGAEQGILQATGELIIGDKLYDFAPNPDLCYMVPNPYAARVDFSKLVRGNVLNRFYVWDTKLTGEFGVGAYQLVDLATGTVTPGGGSYPTLNTIIESGQAFFIVGNTAGINSQLTFNENAKVDGPEQISMGNREAEGTNTSASNTLLKLKMKLINPSNAEEIYDGVYAQFEPNGVAAIDGGDAEKFDNTGENISIIRNSKDLLLERRPLPVGEETLPLRLWNTRQIAYRFAIEPITAPYGFEVKATLEDAFLQKSTPLSSDAPVQYDFVVNGQPTSTGNRFKVVLNQTKLIFGFDNTAIAENTGKAEINWGVKNEFFQKNYSIERSRNGINFSPINTLVSLNTGKTGAYTFADENPSRGKSYYRLKTIDNDGAITYSPVMTFNIGGPLNQKMPTLKQIKISPNPVVSNNVSVQFGSLPAGKYTLTLVGQNGVLLATKVVDHNGYTANYSLSLPLGIRTGKYDLQIASTNGTAPITLNFIKE